MVKNDLTMEEPKIIEMYPEYYQAVRERKRMKRIRIFGILFLAAVFALGWLWLIYWK